MSSNPPPEQNYFAETLLGVVDVMFGRKSGLSRVDLTQQGFWWSFFGIALTGLIDASAYSMSFATHQFADSSAPPAKIWFILGSLLIALIAYGASMLVLMLMCRTPQEQNRFSAAVIVNNWASPIVSLAVLPIVYFSVLFRPIPANSEFWAVVSVLLMGGLIVLGTNLLRISMQLSLPRALLFFAVTSLVSLVCVEGLGLLVGFSSRT